MSISVRLKPSIRPLVYGGLIAIVSALCFAQYGFEGRLTRDTANLIYSGQQMARGVPHYVSTFNHSGPLSHIIAGVSVSAARLLNADDVVTVRSVFFIFAILTAVAVHLLASTLFESHAVGFLSAFAFLGFECFGEDAASGPRAKTPMVLFQTLALALAARRSWFWSGVCGSLAFLVWQPMAIFPLLTIFLAFAQSPSGRDRRRNLILAASGALAPVVLTCVYFLSKGAFDEMIEGVVVFNLFYLEREPSSLLQHVATPIGSILRSYSIMAVPIFLAFLALGFMYVWRVRLEGGIRRTVSNDRFAVILLSLPAPLLWSMMDFQGCPDFYVFLPYLAIGFGWLLFLMSKGLVGLEAIGPEAQNFILVMLCLLLIIPAALEYRRNANRGLIDQRTAARALESEFGSEIRIISISAPELLVLMKRTNPNRYVFIASGVDNYLDARTPGGFDGWLEQLEDYNPDVIALGPATGRFNGRLVEWLKSRYSTRSLLDWKLYVKEPQPRR
ncbi:MAG: DolP-mannose mannosyltransferase [Blastocatellia bacterium]|nr:DolP-mannose mannosyltransferase [Blastocatellia bacterium]